MSRSFALAVFALFIVSCAGCGRPADVASAAREAAAPAASGASLVTGAVAAPSNGLPSIVLLEPKISPAIAPPTEPKTMDQFGQAFFPTLLIASAGQPVEFRNSEDTLHNIRVYHVETKEPAFNISLPQAQKYTFRFERPGFYAVSCDIHPAMAADILITTTPYSAITDADGRFTIADVPPGPYTLAVLNAGRRTQRDVTVVAPKTQLSF